MKKKVHFLHIGKTGGSVVRAALKPYLDKGKYNLEFHGHRFKLMDVPGGEKVVFFIREPISKFISGFYSRKRQGRPLYDVPWRPGEKKAFSKFKTPNELAKALSSKDEELKKAAKSAMKSITHIRTRYWYWFKNKKYFTSRKNDILFVGTQENLNSDFKKLKSLLKIKGARLSKDPIIAHINPTNVDKKISKSSILNLRRWYEEDYKFIDICTKCKLI